MTKINFQQKKAFSLIELSVLLMILGILIIGVIGSKHLIKKAKINSAQSITRSSPVNAIPNNKLWLESALSDISLGEGLATGDLLTSWEDASPSGSLTVITAVGTGPTYSNSINDIQAVKFDENSDSNYLQLNNMTILNDTDYTIFIVDKRIAVNASVDNYFLGESGDFGIGYESNTSVIQTHSEDASTDNQVAIESLSLYSNKPRVFSFTHSSVNGNKIYINATLANEDTTSTAKAHLSGLTTLAVGKGYNGEIGEIIIFDRNLKNSERKEIENYLSDKWGAPNNRESAESCTTGTITSSGCESSCAVSVIGSDQESASLADGASETSTCNESNFDGSDVTYTCSGSAINVTCDCDSGYILESGSCVVEPVSNCEGGALDKESMPGYTMHIFTTVGSQDLNCSGFDPGNAEILVVAGGGGGGGISAGGGGAGGVIYKASYTLTSAVYSISVGAGGDGGTGWDTESQNGKVGEDSVFDEESVTAIITASGGGGGGHFGGNTDATVTDGGSGGGGSLAAAAGVAATVFGQEGNNGGSHGGDYRYAAGGGGAGGIGGSSTSLVGGAGGTGVYYGSKFSDDYGDMGWFASGGGGGAWSPKNAGSASIGGGTSGVNSSIKASNATANTGGGGGGSGFNGHSDDILGGNGGSGIVIVKYPTL